MRHIGIIGHGWLGERIAKYFSSSDQIYATTTNREKAEKLSTLGYQSFVQVFSDERNHEVTHAWKILDALHVIIITVPFARRTPCIHLQNRFENIVRFIQGYKGLLFLMSSTGIYPQKSVSISENTYDDHNLHPNLITIEREMQAKFPQINILRLGGLMGDDRQLKNYNIKDATGVVNYVHYTDIILVIEKMIENGIRGKTYNVVAPLHPTKLAVLNKNEKAWQNKNEGRVILSNKLQDELNYKFIHPNPVKFA